MNTPDPKRDRLLFDYRRRIEQARVYEVADITALEVAPKLSERIGNRLLLKREDQQPVHSFKLRGAYNHMARLDPDARRRGVVAASAGNHAQGVALGASRLNLRATIVMPLVGRYATSMEMAGVSFTICKLDDELETLLKAPCDCAFWRV